MRSTIQLGEMAKTHSGDRTRKRHELEWVIPRFGLEEAQQQEQRQRKPEPEPFASVLRLTPGNQHAGNGDHRPRKSVRGNIPEVIQTSRIVKIIARELKKKPEQVFRGEASRSDRSSAPARSPPE